MQDDSFNSVRNSLPKPAEKYNNLKCGLHLCNLSVVLLGSIGVVAIYVFAVLKD